MNVLKAIIERLNQKLDASNLFPSLYGIAAPDPNNAKSFLAYDGNGQNLITADYDKTDGTCFWTLRGSVSVRKNDGVQVKACQDMYITTFPLRAYTVVKKSSLPCDSNATEGYVMDMFFKYVQGKDTALRSNIGVTDIYFRPVGVVSNTPDLPKQFEYVTLYFDLDVEVTAQLIEGCYDECGVNPIPLPDGSCPPINRVVSVTGLDTDNADPSRPIVKISVDGTTITGQGTPDDPLVAIGGGGGGSLRVQDEGTTVTNAATSLNFTGNVTASLASTGNVTVNVPSPTPQVNADWNASSGVAEILNKPTIPNAQVNSDWNASSGVAQILNKPSIPAAQIQSDWNQANNAALDFIKNKPTIPSGTVESVNSGINISVDNTDPDNPIINSLSDRYKTTSNTSNSVSNGSKNFTVDLNLSYIPLQEILVVFDSANHMHGEVTSYNPATGALVVDIKNHTGSGTYTAWTLNLDGTPVDALTGSGTANEIAYFTAARVLSSLPVATYPSLTELSYVKGVTSAIQTQINGKFATPSGTTSQYVRGDGSLATFPTIGLGTVLSVSATVPSPASPALSVSVLNPTTTPAISITANGNTSQLIRGDGSLAAIPTAPTIYKSTSDQLPVTGVTTNTKVVSVLIPANTVTVGAIVEIKARAGKTGGAGISTLRVYANTADSIVSPAPTLLITAALPANSSTYIGIDRSAIVKSAIVTQTAQANASIPTDAAVGTASLTNSNIDWTVNQYIIFALQNASIADSTTLSYYQIEIK